MRVHVSYIYDTDTKTLESAGLPVRDNTEGGPEDISCTVTPPSPLVVNRPSSLSPTARSGHTRATIARGQTMAYSTTTLSRPTS
jgi:hypothetical protein